MPVDLHQRLSEFSYGYGVTRDVERQLQSIGLTSVPFLPNLQQEAGVGYDAKFDRPGAALLLQFKLGEALQRFVRSDLTKRPPALDKPFWRFRIDTAETDGQFDVLRKAELGNAEVYYVAPRFTSWDEYAVAFQSDAVLERSLLIKPSEIDAKLAAQGEPDGNHRIVYDQSSVFVCSEPAELAEQDTRDLGRFIRQTIERRGQRLDQALTEVYLTFDQRREIRHPRRGVGPDEGHPALIAAQVGELSPSREQIAVNRARRLSDLRARGQGEADAMLAALGMETWVMGAQLIAVTLDA